MDFLASLVHISPPVKLMNFIKPLLKIVIIYLQIQSRQPIPPFSATIDYLYQKIVSLEKDKMITTEKKIITAG